MPERVMPFAAWQFVAETLLAQQWIFARTMPEAPHWYTLRKRWTDDAAFVQCVTFLRQYGYTEIYKRTRYTMLDINEHKYWTMGAALPATILINRACHRHAHPYDQIAPVYETLFTDAESLAENETLMALLPQPLGSVLDIGCGTGLFLDYLRPSWYVGIDASQQMLTRATKKYPGHGWIHTPFESFYTTARFETIVALFGTASYLCPAFLPRIQEFLVPGGRYFLMFFAPDYVPITHVRSGIAVDYAPESWKMLPDATLMGWQHYVIAQYEKPGR